MDIQLPDASSSTDSLAFHQAQSLCPSLPHPLLKMENVLGMQETILDMLRCTL